MTETQIAAAAFGSLREFKRLPWMEWTNNERTVELMKIIAKHAPNATSDEVGLIIDELIPGL